MTFGKALPAIIPILIAILISAANEIMVLLELFSSGVARKVMAEGWALAHETVVLSLLS